LLKSKVTRIGLNLELLLILKLQTMSKKMVPKGNSVFEMA
jgi:hypothetical protein